MTRNSRLKKSIRARMSDTGDSYTAARAKVRAKRVTATGLMHITNGDSAAASLREALGTYVMPWRDVLHEGPVPGLPVAKLRLVRARFLAQRYGGKVGAVAAMLEERDRALLGHRGRYLLWFDADLYDQLQLIQILAELRRVGVAADSISLINPGEMIGRAHFGGLGELEPAELATLVQDAVTLLPATLELAAKAWAAFRAPEPNGVVTVARTADTQLRFLGESFGRVLQLYPSVSDGLPLTARRTLLAVDDEATTAGAAFRWISERERRPFLGDAQFFDMLGTLANGPEPLVTLLPPASRPLATTGVTLTHAGRQVLRGRRRYGWVDHWIGGVHLAPGLPSWRYDDRLETLVATE